MKIVDTYFFDATHKRWDRIGRECIGKNRDINHALETSISFAHCEMENDSFAIVVNHIPDADIVELE